MLEIDLDDLHDMQLTIARLGQTKAGVQDILWMLAMSDWEEVYQNDTSLCSHCRKQYPLRDLINSPGGGYGQFCPSCFYGNGERTCYRCHTVFLLPVTDRRVVCNDCVNHVCGICNQIAPLDDRHVVCQSCYADKGLCDLWERREYAKLVTHEGRARNLEQVGHLPLRPWLTTLNYFYWRCAYCQQSPYEHIDHFIPLCHKGNSTLQNCVPSCQSCNKKKGQRIPSKVTSIPRADLERVQVYLQTR